VVRRLQLDRNPQLEILLRPDGRGGALETLRSAIVRGVRSTIGLPVGSASESLPRPSNTDETPAETNAVALVAADLEIQTQPAGHLLRIVMSSGSPSLSAAVANALASEYAGEDPERRRRRVRNQLDIVSAALADLTAQIDVDRKTLSQTGSNATTVDRDALARETAAAEAAWQRKQAAREAAEQKSREMAALDPEHHADAAQRYADVVDATAAAKRQIATLIADRLSVIKEGAKHDGALIQAVDSQIARLQQDLVVAIRGRIELAQQDYAAALAEEQTAARVMKAEQALDARNGRAAITVAALTSEINAGAARRDDWLAEQRALEAAAGSVAANMTVVEDARPPGKPYEPNAARNVIVSLGFGLTVALLLAFGLDRLDDTIKTPEDITHRLHVPFLGLVPAIRGDRPPVLSGQVPHAFGEAYRALRTSIVFTSGADTARMIAVTSAQSLEGRTTTACNLALVLAFGGSRVLLIDADLRRPAVHKAMGMTNTIGLSHLLVGQARVREAIQRTNDPNLCVITAGRTHPNPAELIGSDRMKQLVANLKQGPFDWVVIDTPPVLAVPDPVILTPLVDGVTFVIGAEMTRRGVAQRAVQMVMAARPKVIGAVLNRVDFERNRYYYSRYYGAQYGTHEGLTAETTGAI
jgi:capsular exopolysaccharide synthesis family protein